MKKGKTKFAILGLLTIKDFSGYEMSQVIQQSIGYFWSESNGQLYPALHQLLKEKLIRLREENEKGERERKIYAITPKGERELQAWQRTEEETQMHRDEGLLKLFFGANVPKTVSLEKLRKRQSQVEKVLEEFKTIKKKIAKSSRSPHALFWRMTLNNGLLLAQAELTWCRESIKLLESSL